MPSPPTTLAALLEPGTPREYNNQETRRGASSHLDAVAGVDQPPGDQGGVRDTLTRSSIPAPNPDPRRLTARDATVLRDLVLLRLLTYEQIHRLAFPHTDLSIARRRIRSLARAGWLHVWEPPSRTGGHARFAHPTRRTLREVLPLLADDAPWQSLIRKMLPRSQRRPLTLDDGSIPKWLPHQREVNHLVTSIRSDPMRHILWSSSWDCPFPSRLGMFVLPQPDYVVVEEVDGNPRLIFGEHDRGSEPPERFLARKVKLYSALAAYPDVCAREFGIPTFQVHVSVIDPIRRAPIARLRSLLDVARSSDAAAIFRFTLGGWLFAWPSQPVWFTAERSPVRDTVAWGEHKAITVAA